MTVRFEPTRNQKIALSGACALLASGTAAAVTKLVGKRVFDLPWLGLSAGCGFTAAAVRWLTFSPSVTLRYSDFFKEGEESQKCRFEGIADGAKWSIEVMGPISWESDTDRARWASAILALEGRLGCIDDARYGEGLRYQVGDVFPTDHPVFLGLVEVWTAVIEGKREVTIERPNLAAWHRDLETGLSGETLAERLSALSKKLHLTQEITLLAKVMRSSPPDQPFSLSVVGLQRGTAEVKGENTLKALFKGIELDSENEAHYQGVNLCALPGTLELWEVGIDGTASIEIVNKK